VLFRVGPPVVVVVAVVVIHCRDGGTKWVVQIGVGVGGDEKVVIEGKDDRSGVRRGARMGVSEVVTDGCKLVVYIEFVGPLHKHTH
jgi:hypothetical protein